MINFCNRFKIELWDEDYNFVRSLSSDTGSEDAAVWIAEDTTAQSHLVSMEQPLLRVEEEAEIVVLTMNRMGRQYTLYSDNLIVSQPWGKA